jgi:hypothetical protein
MADAPIIDLYSGMDHKAGMDPTDGGSYLDASPKFYDTRAKRRVNFYARCRAYLETVSRYYATPDPDNPAWRDEARDYGDLAVLIAQMAGAVLGEGVTVVVDGADDALPDTPDIGPAPRPPDDSTLPEERAILDQVYAARLARWQEAAQAALDDWIEDAELSDVLHERQGWLRRWAVDEQLLGKINQAETESIVPLGDGALVVGWDPMARRPTVEIYEPDAYHPVLDDATPGRFPARVHLAWIFERTVDGKAKEFVRRITYELVPLDEVDGDIGPAPAYLEPTDTWTHVCLQSDGEWPLDAFESIDGLSSGVTWRVMVDGDGNEVELNRFPTGLDFIPVIHVPNMLTNEHFGRSPVPRLVQLVDEIIATDTDAALASRWASRPPVVVSGLGPPLPDGTPRTLDMTPGKGVSVEPGGSLSTIDMAPNLSVIMDRTDRLLRRLSVNARVPEGVVGRVNASEVPSGLALTLSFTPFQNLIEAMRLAREPKYALLLKMVQRVAIQAGDETLGGDTRVYPARLRFGVYMPSDLAGLASTLYTLRQAKLVSQETGVLALQEAGVPSGDLVAELASIRRYDMTAEADAVTGALENPRYAAELMGIDDYEGPAGGLDTEGGAVLPPADPGAG